MATTTTTTTTKAAATTKPTTTGNTTTARVSRVTGSTTTATSDMTTRHDDGNGRQHNRRHNNGTGQHQNGQELTSGWAIWSGGGRKGGIKVLFVVWSISKASRLDDGDSQVIDAFVRLVKIGQELTSGEAIWWGGLIKELWPWWGQK